MAIECYMVHVRSITVSHHHTHCTYLLLVYVVCAQMSGNNAERKESL